MRKVIALAPAVLLVTLATHGCKSRPKISECARLFDQIETVLETDPLTCASAADCACVTDTNGCGGIASKKTADRIRELNAEVRTKKCEKEEGCMGRPPCVATCMNGRCDNGAYPPKTATGAFSAAPATSLR